MNEHTTAWVFALLASLFEVCWLLSLKYLNMKELTNLQWLKFDNISASLATVLPFFGYLCFGLANVICFSMATKKLPTAVVFATWLAVALIITTIIDVSFFKQNYTWVQLLFILVILLGVVGLKMSTSATM